METQGERALADDRQDGRDIKVAVVTGASRGIGKQTALMLARRRFRVVIVARTEEPREATPGTLGQTADEISAVGLGPVVVSADLALQDDIDRVVGITLETCGHVDVLVNNAAYTVGRTLRTHVPDLTRAQWDKHFAINVTAPLMLTQGFWSSMQERGGGVIVNVTSGAARPEPVSVEGDRATGVLETGPAYGSTKAALNRMTNLVAHDGFENRIAVIAMEPGFVLTETMARSFAEAGVTDTDAISPTVPASAITYLCTCDDPLRYSGEVLDGPALAAELSLPLS
jgi:NAD(P)-dependent dehydrogenase (short-subunit alcohol dehydrogenase family)